VQLLKQSTAPTLKIGPFLDDTDGKTAETGLTIAQADVRISKNGANIIQKSDNITCIHDELGIYACILDATDTNTLGRLQLWVHESGALPVWHEYMVVTANVYDSLCSTDILQADLTQIGGVAQSATDLKDFADAGYDPAANKITGCKVNDDMVGTDNAALATGVNVTQLGGGAQSLVDLKDFADAGYDPALNKINGVKQTDTTVTNSDMRGTDNAALAATALTDVTWTDAKAGHLDAPISTVDTVVDGIQTDLSNATDGLGALKALIDTIDGIVDTILVDTNELQTDWVNGGRLDLILDIIAADTTTDIPAKLLKYAQLLARSDAAIATDNATELTAINADGGSGAGNFSNQTDSVEAIRDRGDVAWITATGFNTVVPDVAGTAAGLHTTTDGLVTTVDTVVDGIQTDLSNATDGLGALKALIDTVDGVVDTILTDTNDLQTNQGAWATATGFSTHSAANVWAVAARTLTANTNFNDLDAAAVKAEVVAALADIKLDHLINIAVDTNWATTVHLDSVIGHLADVGTAATFDRTTDAQEAIRNRGDAAWTTGAGGTPPTTLQNTTIATLASQTSFTLTAGSSDDDAYNDCIAVVEDSATSTQKCVGRVLNYTGATKTVTLEADPGVFTMAAGDTIDVIAVEKTWTAATKALTDKAGFSLAADQSGVTVGTVNALGAQAKLDVNAEADTALTDYDAPTKTEMDTAFTEIKGATWAAGTDTLEHIRNKETDIETDTAEIGIAGAGLTGLGGMAAGMKAEVESEANDALVALKLDHLIAVADADDAVNDSIVAKMAASDGDWSGFDKTADSLEAIRDRGDAAWTTGAGGSDRLLMVDTTIATLASQTSFTLTAGSTDNNAYNNCTIVIEDAATATQKAVGIVSAYTGATKTVTLKYDPAVFTIATTDKVYILAENALKATLANRQLNVAADGDIAGNVDGSVASLVGHTAQTGDGYAVVSHADHGNAKLVRSTTPANKLDVSATGEAGLDFANIKNAAGAHTLTNITVPTVTTLTGHTAQTGDSFARLGAPVGASIAADLVTIDGVVDAILIDTGTTLNDMVERILGISQENFYIDTTVFTGANMTSCRIRLYSVAGSVGTAADVIATYNMTSTYAGDNLASYKMVKA
jgi:hypothetical protein